MRSRDWTPDEIVLTIEAYFQIYREGADKGMTIAALAAELHRSASSVEAAVDALKSADPTATGGPQLTVVAEALASAYLVPNKATQTKTQARKIRELWRQVQVRSGTSP